MVADVLEDDDIPRHVVDELFERLGVRGLVERPVRCRVLDGVQRLGTAVVRSQLVDHRGHLVVVREAVSYEEHAETGAIALGEGEVSLRAREEWAADDSGLRKPDVEGHGQQQPGAHTRDEPQNLVTFRDPQGPCIGSGRGGLDQEKGEAGAPVLRLRPPQRRPP